MLFLCMSSAWSTPDADVLDRALENIAKGDRDALAQLYYAAHDAVYAFALSILRNPYDAEDVLQDTFLTCWSAASGYKSQGKPLAWILTVTRSLCLQHLREQKKAADLPPEEWEPWLRDNTGLSPEDRMVLEQCMLQLTEEERKIVVLHAVAGFRHREIAAFLSLALPTVLSKYARAIKKLQAHL